MKQPKEQINGRTPLGELSSDLKDFDESLANGKGRVNVFGAPTFVINAIAKAIKEQEEKEQGNAKNKETNQNREAP